MAIEISKLVNLLKSNGVTINDVEKEISCREKWGKMRNPIMMDFTTDELREAFENWVKF